MNHKIRKNQLPIREFKLIKESRKRLLSKQEMSHKHLKKHRALQLTYVGLVNNYIMDKVF